MIIKGFAGGDRPLGLAGDSHPDWSMAFTALANYRVVGASAVGKLHIQKNKPRDDAFVIRAAGNWLAVGVSDGLGSRDLSRFGASQAADAIAAFLLQPFIDESKTGSRDHYPPLPQLKVKHPRIKLPSEPTFPNTVKSKWQSLEDKAKNHLSFFNQRADQPNILQIDVPGIFEEGVELNGSLGYWTHSRQISTHPAEAMDPQDYFGSLAEPDLTSDAETNSNLEVIAKNALEKTHIWLEKCAQSMELTSRDIGCTVHGFLFNVKDGIWLAAQVGDGAFLGLSEDGVIHELIDVEESDDLTRAPTITSESWEKFIQIQTSLSKKTKAQYRAFFIMSDGVSTDLLYQPDVSAVNRWADGVVQTIQSGETALDAASKILSWLSTYEASGSFDDRTLVSIVKA